MSVHSDHVWHDDDQPVLDRIATLSALAHVIDVCTLIADTGRTHRQVHEALVRLHDAQYIEARDTTCFDHPYPTRDVVRLTPLGLTAATGPALTAA